MNRVCVSVALETSSECKIPGLLGGFVCEIRAIILFCYFPTGLYTRKELEDEEEYEEGLTRREILRFFS